MIIAAADPMSRLFDRRVFSPCLPAYQFGVQSEKTVDSHGRAEIVFGDGPTSYPSRLPARWPTSSVNVINARFIPEKHTVPSLFASS